MRIDVTSSVLFFSGVFHDAPIETGFRPESVNGLSNLEGNAGFVRSSLNVP
jgi:hypothetical protein